MSEVAHEAHLSQQVEDDVVEYRPLCGLAIAGLALGLVAPLAFLHPALWVFPAGGLFISGLALWRIIRGPVPLVGRTAALVGLALSAVSAAGAPSELLTYRWIISREARQFAAAWFQMLAANEPQKAFLLTLFPEDRVPFDSDIWSAYLKSSTMREEMESFLIRPEVRALLALGPRADARYYETERYTTERDGHLIEQTYAVSYEQDGRKKTFFISLLLRRLRFQKTGQARWQLVHFEGGIRPRAFGGDG